MSSETQSLKTLGVRNNLSSVAVPHRAIVFLSLSWGFLSTIGSVCLVGVYGTPDCVKHAGGYLPRTTLALPWEKAAGVHLEAKPSCLSNLEKAFGWLALSVLCISEALSGTFQGTVCFGRCESPGLFLFINL